MKPSRISYCTSDMFSIPLAAKELLTLGTDDGIAWFYSDNDLTIEFFLNGRADFEKRTVIGSCTIPYLVDTEESRKILQRNNILTRSKPPAKPIDPDATYLGQFFPEFIDKEIQNYPENRQEIHDIIDAFCDFMYRFHKAPVARWMPKNVKFCILDDLTTNPCCSQWEEENTIPVLCRFFSYLKSKGILPQANALILAANAVLRQFLRLSQAPVQVHTNPPQSFTRSDTASQMPDPTRSTPAPKKPIKPVATPVQRPSTVPHGTSALPFGALLHNPHDMVPEVEDSLRSPGSNAGIPVEVISIYEPLHMWCNKFCDLYPNLPIREGCMQLLKAFAKKTGPPFPLLSGRFAVWGAGIVYATCQATGFTRGKNWQGIGTDEVAVFFKVPQSTLSAKTLFIKRKIRSAYFRYGGENPKGDLTDMFDPEWAECFRRWAGYND